MAKEIVIIGRMADDGEITIHHVHFGLNGAGIKKAKDPKFVETTTNKIQIGTDGLGGGGECIVDCAGNEWCPPP